MFIFPAEYRYHPPLYFVLVAGSFWLKKILEGSGWDFQTEPWFCLSGIFVFGSRSSCCTEVPSNSDLCHQTHRNTRALIDWAPTCCQPVTHECTYGLGCARLSPKLETYSNHQSCRIHAKPHCSRPMYLRKVLKDMIDRSDIYMRIGSGPSTEL